MSGAKLIWSKHYGYAEAETKRVADNDTAYRIGSITKQFTALALLQLVEQGKMRLTDPLEKYVPEIGACKGAPRRRAADHAAAGGDDDVGPGARAGLRRTTPSGR